MSNRWDADAAQTLLDEFSKQVPPRPERPPTLMEISGYPHYENVCSNILAFFLDPGNPHGLGTLFLDALVQAGGIGEQGGEIGVNIQIRREETTRKGNRIDILIQSESHAIVIENKIFHEIGNPFEDYIKHVETQLQATQETPVYSEPQTRRRRRTVQEYHVRAVVQRSQIAARAQSLKSGYPLSHVHA